MSEAIFELTGGIQQPGKYTHFHEILYTAADFELDECHVIKNEKNCIGQMPSSTERTSCFDENVV